jgi:hypothetical protein
MTKEIKLQTQTDAVVYFIRKLDAEMTGDILDDNRTYQDFPKHIFIQKFVHALDEFISAGDKWLDCQKGCCNGESCNFNKQGFRFTGDNSGKYMDLIIEIKNEKILDIYECHCFKTEEKSAPAGKRIIIDNGTSLFGDAA